ncbi:MAG TPA: IS66 family transposase [Gemmataceae bacterium]|jgi:transposase|nr:IS66 family transposase [Gemmataceae bacterium]
MTETQLEEVLRRAEQALDDKDATFIRQVFESYLYVTDLVEDKKTTIARLRQLFFGKRTEKTKAVVGSTPPQESGSKDMATTSAGIAEPSTADKTPGGAAGASATASKGHGRNGADAYRGAERIDVPHGTLQAGDPCPTCGQGTVYEKEPGVLVRITGQPPLSAKIYQLQKLRCHLCGAVFTASAPAEAGEQKYDARSGSMIGLLKYGSGLPFNRLEGLQGHLEIPLPASTQWDIVKAVAANLRPAFTELIRQAAQGEVLHNDDTTVKILALMGKRARQEPMADDEINQVEQDNAEQRTGLFTSGVVALRDGQRVALFFSGRRHAGENLAEVLKHRAQELPPPIQMCDALARNLPGTLQTLVANCLAHARRQFVDVYDRFPEQCRHLLEALAVVYRNDARARERQSSPEARLQFHQESSQPAMQQLHAWLTRQMDDKLVEPNSALGGAMRYMLRHWDKLTLFLRKAGAPLDNNVCERALKKAILHRKNALFYKTQNGARVGDLFMSLIYTCQLNQVNPFDYLTQLQWHSEKVAASPELWMPWNYHEVLAGDISANEVMA